jgi:hypothetical protein
VPPFTYAKSCAGPLLSGGVSHAASADAEAEVGCEVCFDELARYVELELAGADADAAIPGLRAHLDGSPACREEHESLRALVSGEQAL